MSDIHTPQLNPLGPQLWLSCPAQVCVSATVSHFSQHLHRREGSTNDDRN